MTGGSLLRRPWLVGLAASCAFFAPALLRPGCAPLPLDPYAGARPWVGGGPVAPVTNGLVYDQAFDFFPWNEFLRRSVAEGEIPLWNPYQGLGQPFAGNMQARIFDPVTWFVAAVNGATGSLYGWTLSAVLRTALSFFFAARLARLLGAGSLGALAAGAVYAFGGFSIVYLNHPNGHVLPWVAAEACFAVRLRREPRGRSVAALAGAVALSIAAGHPEAAAHGLAAAVAAFLLAGGAGRPPFGRLALALVIGLALAAPAVFPIAEYLGKGAVAADRAAASRMVLAEDRPLLSIPWTLAGVVLFLLARRALGPGARTPRRVLGIGLVAAALLSALHFAPRDSGGESLGMLLWPHSVPPAGSGEVLASRAQTTLVPFLGIAALFLLLGTLAGSTRGERREPFVWLWLLALADFLVEPATRLLLHGWWPGILIVSFSPGSAGLLLSAVGVGRALRFGDASAAGETWARFARGAGVTWLCAVGIWLDHRTGPLRVPRRAEDAASTREGMAAVLAFPSPDTAVSRRLVANGYLAMEQPLASLEVELRSGGGESFRRPCDRWRERPSGAGRPRTYEWYVLWWDTARIPRGTHRLVLRARDEGGVERTSQDLGPITLGPFERLGDGRFALILGAVGVAIALGALLRRAPGWLLLAGIAADPIANGFGFNGASPSPLPGVVEDRFVEEVRRTVGHDRVLPDSGMAVLPGESATLVRIRDLWNYDFIHPLVATRLIREVGPGSGPSTYPWGPIDLRAPKVALLGLGGLVGTAQGTPPTPWRLAGERGAVRFFAREGPGGRAFLAEAGSPLENPLPAHALGKVEFVEDGANRVVLRVEAERAALLVLADLHFPGWRARLDGAKAEILPVGGAVRGVRVPSGEHLVEFRYAPFSFTLGLLVAALATAVVLGFLANDGARARR